MESGTVQRWLAAEGQPVEAGAALLEVETDKVVVEVEALRQALWAGGRGGGQSVPIGTVLAQIYGPGERQTGAGTGRRRVRGRIAYLRPAVNRHSLRRGFPHRERART
jgi:pyruvate/2-oxoglutarate dehydrogenase complex dihydrolipoamide acyltransferase (E2) component